MTYITTGIVDTRFSKKKTKNDKDDENHEELNFEMDAYNSGLIFGSIPELNAFRLNQRHERKLLNVHRQLETERLQALREHNVKQNNMLIKSDKLKERRHKFITYLEPVYYNELSRLFQDNKLKPMQTHCRRVNSAKLIAEKARQLQLNSPDGRWSAPAQCSVRSLQTHRDSYPPTIRKTIIRHDATQLKHDDSDDIIVDKYGGKVRVTIADNMKKMAPLTLQQSLRAAITIKQPNQMTREHMKVILDETKLGKIHHMELNLQAIGAEYVTGLIIPSGEYEDGQSQSSSVNEVLVTTRRQRCISAHPNLNILRPRSSRLYTPSIETTTKDTLLKKKVDTFCRSLSQLN